MSRTIGPFRGVSTLRVEGAYELCAGVDGEGRPVEILTLGSSSSKDPSRRAMLMDAVAWAHANSGIDDSPILEADLNADQPYVVVFQDEGRRGAERILERLLALGPATGRLPRPQVPGSTATKFISSMPPAPPKAVVKRRRKSMVRPLILSLLSAVLLFALTGGAWMLWAAFKPGSDEGARPPAADAGQKEDGVPEWNPDAPSESLGGETFDDEKTQTFAVEGWPVAFRVPAEFKCGSDGGEVECETPEGGTFSVEWSACEGCGKEKKRQVRSEMELQPMRDVGNPRVAFQHSQLAEEWHAQGSFFTDGLPGREDVDGHVVVTVAVPDDDKSEAQKALNDVLNQTLAAKF
ncbi:hypothetical protein [Salininema proteolyticum]|uniref:Uncharacterized protein n=1 Tax=Salininema proteolyticum TaxID=1607685 RepID=A0ABV8U3Q2_9ACTN